MVSQEQRRRQLAREKFLRQQQRRTSARRKARMRNSVIASVLGVVVIGSLALYTTGVLKDDGAKKENAGAEVSPTPTSKAPDPCEKPAAGKVKTATWKKEPELTVDKSAKYTMKLATTCGDIDIALKASAAPHTVNSFDFLVGKGYLDHSKCHRLTDSGIYVLQCGDPKGTGMGGPGYTIPDENLKDKSLKGVCTRRARWRWPTSTTHRRSRGATPEAASSSSSTRTVSCRPTTHRSARCPRRA